MMHTLEEDSILQQALSRYSFVQAAYIFGSRATGRAKAESDLDWILNTCTKSLGI